MGWVFFGFYLGFHLKFKISFFYRIWCIWSSFLLSFEHLNCSVYWTNKTCHIQSPFQEFRSLWMILFISTLIFRTYSTAVAAASFVFYTLASSFKTSFDPCSISICFIAIYRLPSFIGNELFLKTVTHLIWNCNGIISLRLDFSPCVYVFFFADHKYSQLDHCETKIYVIKVS